MIITQSGKIAMSLDRRENERFLYADEQAEEAFFGILQQCYPGNVLDLREPASRRLESSTQETA